MNQLISALLQVGLLMAIPFLYYVWSRRAFSGFFSWIGLKIGKGLPLKWMFNLQWICCGFFFRKWVERSNHFNPCFMDLYTNSSLRRDLLSGIFVRIVWTMDQLGMGKSVTGHDFWTDSLFFGLKSEHWAYFSSCRINGRYRVDTWLVKENEVRREPFCGYFDSRGRKSPFNGSCLLFLTVKVEHSPD